MKTDCNWAVLRCEIKKENISEGIYITKQIEKLLDGEMDKGNQAA